MARFDVYRMNGNHIVFDVQADLLDHLRTRVVVPLMTKHDAPVPAQFLNPVFNIDGTEYVMVTQFLSAVDQSTLSKPIADISEYSDQITRALDMVFQGF